MLRGCGGWVTRFLFGAGLGVVIEGAARGGAVALENETSRRGKIDWRRMHMPFVRGVMMRRVLAGAAVVSAMGLAACSTPHLFGSKGNVPNPTAAASVSVNGYLWRATLDTLSFMP